MIIATGIAMRSELCDLSSLDEICSTTEKKVFPIKFITNRIDFDCPISFARH